MRVLFVLQNFPGQFRHLAEVLVKRPGVEVAAIGDRLCLTRDLRPQVEGLRLVTYPFEDGAAKTTHPFARGYERTVRRGEQAAKAALELKSAGFTPDLIYAHPGWGEALYLREVFPEARQLHFLEFYYHPTGVDAGFDPEYPSGLDEAFRIRSRNATQLQSLDLADWFVAPTRWQASLYPPAFRQRTSVIFDGIDTARVRPRPDAQATLKEGGVTVKAGDEIITFVARQLESYRGFHVFMRALPEILAARPQARVLIVGGSGVSYGRALPKGESYRTRLLAEVVTPGETGLLVDFFDRKALARTVIGVLSDEIATDRLRRNARRLMVERYDLKRHCLPQQLALLRTLVDGGTPEVDAVP